MEEISVVDWMLESWGDNLMKSNGEAICFGKCEDITKHDLLKYPLGYLLVDDGKYKN